MTAILAWLAAHELSLGMLVIAIIDFVFDINPASKSNNILSWILNEVQSIVSTLKPPTPPAS